MKIWELLLDGAYEKIGPVDETFYDLKATMFKGELLKNHWENLELSTYFKGEKAERGEKADILNFDGVPVFTPNFYDLIKNEISNHIQALPASHKEYGNLKVINVITVLDCIDEEKSKFRTFGKTRMIETYVFKENIIYPSIFKIETDNRWSCYVTEKFTNIVKQNNIKGANLKLVWND